MTRLTPWPLLSAGRIFDFKTMVKALLDFILHSDVYLNAIIQSHGNIVYLFIFIIIFLETGFVVAPFLPGDSLLFIAGALAAIGDLNIYFVLLILALAAILGDTANYWLGHYFGEKAFTKLIRPEHLEKTKSFFNRHGKKTILLARFVPIIRTIAPFVAGVGKMDYLSFLKYNIIGGIIWAFLFILLGYFFGNISLIKNNLSFVVLLIILISLLPIIIGFLGRKKNRS